MPRKTFYIYKSFFFLIIFVTNIIGFSALALEMDSSRTQEERAFFDNLENAQNAIAKDQEELSSLQSGLSFILRERNRVLLEVERAIPQIESQISNYNSSTNISALEITYNKTVLYWRVLTDNSLDFFVEKSDFKLNKPKSLDANITIPEDLQNNHLSKEYLKSYQKLSEEYQQFVSDNIRFVEMVNGKQLTLLLRIGKNRAELIRLLDSDSHFVKSNEYYFEDLSRELQLIPYRPRIFFYSKLIDYQNLLTTGFSGYVSITSQIFFLLFAFFTLLYGSTLLRKATKLLDILRERSVRDAFYSQKHQIFSSLLTKIIPYFPWIFLIIIVDSSALFIQSTSLPEISLILPYFIYYFIYKILRIMTSSILDKILYLELSDGKLAPKIKEKIKNTSKRLGLYLLVAACFLHLAETVVREALVYNLVLQLFSFGLVILLLSLARIWRKEISQRFSEHFNHKFSKRLARMSIGKASIILTLPLLFGIILKILIYKIFVRFENYDFSKRILAQLYRKKLESAAKKINTSAEEEIIPESYLVNFKGAQDNLLEISSHPHQEITDTLEAWMAKRIKENSMVIFGEGGIGKTSLLNKISQEFSDAHSQTKIIRINFDKKISDKTELSDYIIRALKITSSLEELEKIIETYPEKTLIVLDGCENLFLSKRDGFTAFKFFAHLVNISSANLFWVTSFHRYSWNYLLHAVDCSKYFRYQFKLKRWSDSDIRTLITLNHEKSKMSLVYDSLIFQMQSIDHEKELLNIQEKFFQMLWSQSRGNPRSAMHLWISALRIIDENTIKITLPKTVKSSDLYRLSDEQLFVCAAIAKHAQLSIGEIIAITNLPKGEALNAVRIGFERGYYSKTKLGCYRLSDEWQIPVSNLLINKNFIYE